MKPSIKRLFPDGLVGLFCRAALAASLVVFFAHHHWALAGDGQPAQTSGIRTSLSNLGSIQKPGDVGRGSLLFRSAQMDELRLAPLVATKVSFEVGGIIARTRIRQTFVNPTDQWLEGIYVFPLPENAAVDSLTMRVGERNIVGVIKEREEARETYETAKSEGMRAALLESERPNVFTSSVANIGPGVSVTVAFEYQQKLRYDQGAFRLRFPMVVAPRYHPDNRKIASAGQGATPAGTGPASPDENAGIPVLTSEGGKTNPVSLNISLKPGFPIGELKSPYHDIDVKQLAEDRYQISLKEMVVPADRDFELVWKPEKASEPTAGLFSETAEDKHYLMAMVMPPTLEAGTERIPREVIFVIDTSGSMAGESIEQAKKALKLAIQRLDSRDRFNVIRFDNNTFALFHEPHPANDEARDRADEALDLLVASGGTRMAPAIELALRGRAPKGYLRQVIFITDGAVGNERELFGIVRQRLGRSRLFTVGIGSAPNSYFMVKAAEVGRGTYTYVGKVSEIGERMEELLRKLEMPILSDLHTEWPEGASADTSIGLLPDLYAGEPLVLTAKVSDVRGNLLIRGCIGNRQWRATLPLGSPIDSSGVAKLWARDKIDGLMNALFEGGNPEEARKQVVALALEHSLVTEFTSLVAVDDTPARPGEESLTSRDVPINLPKGWDHSKVFGVPGQPARAWHKGVSQRASAAPASSQLAPSALSSMAQAHQGSASLAPIAPSPMAVPTRPPHGQLRPRVSGGWSSGSKVGAGSQSKVWIESSEIDLASSVTDSVAEGQLPCGQPMKG